MSLYYSSRFHYSMKRSQPQKIGSFMQAYFDRYGLQDKIKEAMAVGCWDKVVDDKVLRRTKTVFVKNRIMYVFFHSATLRNEMMMQRESLLQRINQQLGSHVIDNIIFH